MEVVMPIVNRLGAQRRKIAVHAYFCKLVKVLKPEHAQVTALGGVGWFALILISHIVFVQLGRVVLVW
jgi:hypothetical protein